MTPIGKGLINNNEIVILTGDKDTTVVSMKKIEYINIISKMVSDGIIDCTYVESEDTIMSDLKHF